MLPIAGGEEAVGMDELLLERRRARCLIEPQAQPARVRLRFRDAGAVVEHGERVVAVAARVVLPRE